MRGRGCCTRRMWGIHARCYGMYTRIGSGLVRGLWGCRGVRGSGDGDGVLIVSVDSRKNKAVRLSYDHKSDDPLEAKRVVESGGFILNSRVNGNPLPPLPLPFPFLPHLTPCPSTP